MRVPFADLKRAHAPIREEMVRAAAAVLDDARYILGPNVTAFEQEVAGFLRAGHAVGVSNGTDALKIALAALKRARGPGKVITSPYTFIATAEAAVEAGLEPVFADVDADTGCLDPAAVEAQIRPGVVGLLPVHLFGQCADMAPLLDLARRHGLWVVEDAAQAFGAEYTGTRAGALGDLGCFSFFPSKNLGGVGDGGLVCTADEGLAAACRSGRAHGSSTRKYHHDFLSGNYRLDELQAAILRLKLRHVDAWNRERFEIAVRYERLFSESGLAGSKAIRPLGRVAGSTHVYHQYVVRTERRDALAAWLAEDGIGHAVYYPVPLHCQTAFDFLGHRPEDFPGSMELARTSIALPVFPGMTAPEQDAVVDSLVRFHAQEGAWA